MVKRSSPRRAAAAGMRRFRTLAEVGCRSEVRQIAHLRADEHIVGDVPTADLCTAANAGSRIETRITSRLPRRSVRAALPHTARTLGRRVDQPLPRQYYEFERRKDGLRLSAAAVVNRTSFGLISSCSLATRSRPVRDPG